MEAAGASDLLSLLEVWWSARRIQMVEALWIGSFFFSKGLMWAK